MQGSKKHSLIIDRETLMLPLPILIIFGFHPVSGDGFPILPLCREWIKKSYPQARFSHPLSRESIEHPSLPNGHTISNSILVRQQKRQTWGPQDFPRASPSLGSRKISRTLRMDFTFSHHQQGSIDFNTDSSNCPAGMYFLIHPYLWINDERMPVRCLESRCIGLHIPIYPSFWHSVRT